MKLFVSYYHIINNNNNNNNNNNDNNNKIKNFFMITLPKFFRFLDIYLGLNFAIYLLYSLQVVRNVYTVLSCFSTIL